MKHIENKTVVTFPTNDFKISTNPVDIDVWRIIYLLCFQEWELLVLYKLHWELSSITPLDYLDHALPRLGLNEELIDMADLRRRTETILVLAATDYQFAYHYPSLLAASAIMTALQSLSIFVVASTSVNSKLEPQFPSSILLYHHPEENLSTCVNVTREIKLRLQTATHTAMVSKIFYEVIYLPYISMYYTKLKQFLLLCIIRTMNLSDCNF